MNRLVLVLVAVSACHHAAPSQEELIRDAQDETRQFFAVAQGGDCTALQPMLAHPEGCADLVDEFRKSHTQLRAVVGAKLDGRDPQLVLVTVDAPSTKFEHTFIVRVKWTPDGWKVAL